MATSGENGIIDYGLPGSALGDEDFMINDWSWSETMDWSPGNVIVQSEGGVSLRLDEADDEAAAPYEGGAVRSRSVAAEGTWSWIAQAPDMEDGAVFAMFLYREQHIKDPWLEYDFEFVGGDTTRVQLSVHMEDIDGNHITNFGKVVIDLGFDASEAAHLYEIIVEENATHFQIDNVTVWSFSAEDMPGGEWLNGNMRSITSLWAASEALEPWTGKWEYPGAPLTADITAIGTPNHPIDSELTSIYLKGEGFSIDPLLDEGESQIYCGGVHDQIFGGAENDKILGASGDDTLNGGAGDDTLRGGGGEDSMTGGRGDDRLFGGAGDDWVKGGTGNDFLQGDEGSDIVIGGSGDDTFVFNAADNVSENDRYIGGSDLDTMVFKFTASEWSSAALQNEMADYVSFVSDQTGLSGESSTKSFQFSKLGLEVSAMESVQIYIDDVLL